MIYLDCAVSLVVSDQAYWSQSYLEEAHLELELGTGPKLEVPDWQPRIG